MQGFDRKHMNKHKRVNAQFDNSICLEDGIYCPTFNLNYRQSIKAGEPFPLYRGKIVRWLLVDKVKEFILCKN